MLLVSTLFLSKTPPSLSARTPQNPAQNRRGREAEGGLVWDGLVSELGWPICTVSFRAFCVLAGVHATERAASIGKGRRFVAQVTSIHGTFLERSEASEEAGIA